MFEETDRSLARPTVQQGAERDRKRSRRAQHPAATTRAAAVGRCRPTPTWGRPGWPTVPPVAALPPGWWQAVDSRCTAMSVGRHFAPLCGSCERRGGDVRRRPRVTSTTTVRYIDHKRPAAPNAQETPRHAQPAPGSGGARTLSSFARDRVVRLRVVMIRMVPVIRAAAHHAKHGNPAGANEAIEQGCGQH
jgi:hypothetical protein